MATAYHNLSDYDFNSVPNAENMRFGIVVSEWNSNITDPLLEGAVTTLKKHGAKDENILVQTVPGSFELTFGSAQMIKSGKVDAVIAIGCVVRGDTPHFDYMCRYYPRHRPTECRRRYSCNLWFDYYQYYATSRRPCRWEIRK